MYTVALKLRCPIWLEFLKSLTPYKRFLYNVHIHNVGVSEDVGWALLVHMNVLLVIFLVI